jgi:DNA-3-methyladenine glycosylase II
MTQPLFTLTPRGPFSLDPVRRMNCGFLLGTRVCSAAKEVKLAFSLEGSFELVGVTLRQVDETVVGTVWGGGETGQVSRQVEHFLGLDMDGNAFARVLAREPALAEAARAQPGFRPVVAYSPYAMAGWCVLSQRLRMSQAAKLQVQMAEAAGDVAVVAGERIAAFPRPQTLLAREGFPGIPAEKWTRLQAVARAALDGALDSARLNAMPYEQARESLLGIRGIGPWSAEGILARGLGPTDALPLAERTLHGAVQLAYRLKKLPTDGEVTALAERWRPFRTWVSVLLISHHFEDARRAAA